MPAISSLPPAPPGAYPCPDRSLPTVAGGAPIDVRAILRNAYRTARARLGLLAERLLPEHGQERLAADAHAYWSDPAAPRFGPRSHWKGTGRFADGGLWDDLGRWHLGLATEALVAADGPERFGRVVEWGCGGGMNAVRFAPLATEFWGVDVNPASLEECGRRLGEVGLSSRFHPVEIDARQPEAALDLLPRDFDFFFCFYVFELLPSPEYGLRVMRIAREVLAPAGLALVQIRYHWGDPRHLPRRRNYTANLVQATTYRLDEFWEACEDIGFEALWVRLLPEQPELGEERYAYYLLRKA